MAFFEFRVDCCRAMMQNQSLLRSCRTPEAWVTNKKWDVGLNFTENTWQMRSPVYITQFPFTTLLFTTLHLVSALPKNTKREEEHFLNPNIANDDRTVTKPKMITKQKWMIICECAVPVFFSSQVNSVPNQTSNRSKFCGEGLHSLF